MRIVSIVFFFSFDCARISFFSVRRHVGRHQVPAEHRGHAARGGSGTGRVRQVAGRGRRRGRGEFSMRFPTAARRSFKGGRRPLVSRSFYDLFFFFFCFFCCVPILESQLGPGKRQFPRVPAENGRRLGPVRVLVQQRRLHVQRRDHSEVLRQRREQQQLVFRQWYATYTIIDDPLLSYPLAYVCCVPPLSSDRLPVRCSDHYRRIHPLYG